MMTGGKTCCHTYHTVWQFSIFHLTIKIASIYKFVIQLRVYNYLLLKMNYIMVFIAPFYSARWWIMTITNKGWKWRESKNTRLWGVDYYNRWWPRRYLYNHLIRFKCCDWSPKAITGSCVPTYFSIFKFKQSYRFHTHPNTAVVWLHH